MKKCLRLLCLISVSLLLLGGCTKKNTKVNPSKGTGEVKKGLNDADKGTPRPDASGRGAETDDDDDSSGDADAKAKAKAEADIQAKAAAEAKAKAEQDAQVKAAAEAEAKAKAQLEAQQNQQQQAAPINSSATPSANSAPSNVNQQPPVTVTMVPAAPVTPPIVDTTKVTPTGSNAAPAKPAADAATQPAQQITGPIKTMPAGTPVAEPNAVASNPAADNSTNTPSAQASDDDSAQPTANPVTPTPSEPAKPTALSIAKDAVKPATSSTPTTDTAKADASKEKVAATVTDPTKAKATVPAPDKSKTATASAVDKKSTPATEAQKAADKTKADEAKKLAAAASGKDKDKKDAASVCPKDGPETKLCTKLHAAQATCPKDGPATKECSKIIPKKSGPADVAAFEKCVIDDSLDYLEKLKKANKDAPKISMLLSSWQELAINKCRKKLYIDDSVPFNGSSKVAEKALSLFPNEKAQIQIYSVIESKKLPAAQKEILYKILNSGVEVTAKNVKYSGVLENLGAASDKVSFLINNYSGSIKTRVYGAGKDKKNIEFALGKTPKSEIRYVFDFSTKPDGIYPLSIIDGTTKTETVVKIVKGDLKMLKEKKEITVILSTDSWTSVLANQLKNIIGIHAPEFTNTPLTYSQEQKEQGVRTCSINGGGISCSDPDYITRVTVTPEDLEKAIDEYIKKIPAAKTTTSAKK
jgi:hypothetical protein